MDRKKTEGEVVAEGKMWLAADSEEEDNSEMATAPVAGMRKMVVDPDLQSQMAPSTEAVT